MMLFMETSAYFLAVRAVVNREDPVGLLYMGAPEDEYDPEVADLIKWREAATAEQISAVFLRWFGESGVMPLDMAARIADGISQARARHLSNSVTRLRSVDSDHANCGMSGHGLFWYVSCLKYLESPATRWYLAIVV